VGEELFRHEIDGHQIKHQEVLWDHLGRTRDVIMGPDQTALRPAAEFNRCALVGHRNIVAGQGPSSGAREE
jgi:hypothetical protein